MGRTPLFTDVLRAWRIARLCDTRRLSTGDGIALSRQHASTRREWLGVVGQAAAAGAIAAVAAPVERVLAQRPGGAALNVGIVGAGLAGLACADALAARGVVASVYEAADRPGGRCWSLRGVFPGQVAERGGELIDNLHKTMLGYAKRFGLATEDVVKKYGDVAYYFDGALVPEAAVVDEFREFVAAMRADLRAISSEITALSHSDADIALDRTSLAEYLDGANGAGLAAGPIARAAIREAYVAEYGLEPEAQSCLNFLLFAHADRRSKFTPFGVFSDERYHVISGNDGIATGLANALPAPVTYGLTLVAVRRTAGGAIELTFDTPGGTAIRRHDVVVLAIPFSVLRHVALDASLDLPAAQRTAIETLGYGTNAKMMVGFAARPWTELGLNGTCYADLAHVQTTWETNPALATPDRAVLTDYSGGDRGAALSPAGVDVEAEAFVGDLDAVFPGAAAAASRRADGTVVAHLEHWPSNPLSLGSYTCYRPGQFTTIAGLEGVPAGSLYFAGEHANSFYEWQGFMEGAALSGLEVAAAILRAARKTL